MSRILLTCVFLVSVCYLGCASTVTLSSAWTNPGYSGKPYNKILVVGMAPKERVGAAFEYELSYGLTSKGVQALAATDGIPRDTKLNKETFKQFFGEEGIDAVFVTGLVSADTVEHYSPGATYGVPIGYYSTWYSYYGTIYTVHSDPGYWTSSAEFVMESNLYDVATKQMVWRGVSKAVDPDNAMEVIEELSKTLVKKLAEDGLIVISKAD